MSASHTATPIETASTNEHYPYLFEPLDLGFTDAEKPSGNGLNASGLEDRFYNYGKLAVLRRACQRWRGDSDHGWYFTE